MDNRQDEELPLRTRIIRYLVERCGMGAGFRMTARLREDLGFDDAEIEWLKQALEEEFPVDLAEFFEGRFGREITIQEVIDATEAAHPQKQAT